jgi:hypothetical protein
MRNHPASRPTHFFTSPGRKPNRLRIRFCTRIRGEDWRAMIQSLIQTGTGNFFLAAYHQADDFIRVGFRGSNLANLGASSKHHDAIADLKNVN